MIDGSTHIDELSSLMLSISSILLKQNIRTKLQKRLAIWLVLLAVGFER